MKNLVIWNDMDSIISDILNRVTISKGMGSPAINRVSKGYDDKIQGIRNDLNLTFHSGMEKIQNSTNISASEMKKFTKVVLAETILKMKDIIDDHLANMYILGLKYSEGSVGRKLDFTFDDEEALEELQGNNSLQNAYDEMNQALQSRLFKLIDDTFKNPAIPLIMILGIMQDAVDQEGYRLQKIVETESQLAEMKGREIGFIKFEESEGLQERENLYKWNVLFDDRTTSCCKNIHRRVGNGVSLARLREIVNDESAKYNSGNSHWEIRDWNPHVNCRSTLVRVGA